MSNIEIEIPKKIYVFNKPVNMCKSFTGLSELVWESLRRKADNGDMFLFVNKQRTYLKILSYVKNGWVIIAKKLTQGKFKEMGNRQRQLTPQELQSFVDAAATETPYQRLVA